MNQKLNDDKNNDSFDAKSLQKLYIDELAEIGKSIDSHITQVSAKIVNSDIGLTFIQLTSGGKYKYFKTSRLAAIIPDAEWCHMLRKVVEPIRDALFQVCKMEKYSDLSLTSVQSRHLYSIKNWGS